MSMNPYAVLATGGLKKTELGYIVNDFDSVTKHLPLGRQAASRPDRPPSQKSSSWASFPVPRISLYLRQHWIPPFPDAVMWGRILAQPLSWKTSLLITPLTRTSSRMIRV